MPARKPGSTPALDVTGAHSHPDLSQFVGTFKGRVMCQPCGKTGLPDEIWIFEHLAGHPETCPEEGCSRIFTRPDMLNRHMRAHGKLYDEVPGESEKERYLRLRQTRSQRLQDASIHDENAA